MLLRGQWIASENEKFVLMMWQDGNLALSFNNLDRVLWQSNTSGVADRLVMEENGNLVIYDYRNSIVWQTNTTGGQGEYVRIKDDGDLVLCDSNGTTIWSTSTAISNFLISAHGNFQVSQLN